MLTKKCKTCGRELLLAEFALCHSGTKDGHRASCRFCMSRKKAKGKAEKRNKGPFRTDCFGYAQVRGVTFCGPLKEMNCSDCNFYKTRSQLAEEQTATERRLNMLRGEGVMA